MSLIVLKDKESYDLIIRGTLCGGLSISDLVELLNQNGESVNEITVSKIIQMYLHKKEVFIEEEIKLIQKMYEEYSCSTEAITKRLKELGFNKCVTNIREVILNYGFEKGCVFSEEESELIKRKYLDCRLSLNKLMEEVHKINPYRTRSQVYSFIKEQGLVKDVSWSKFELDILNKYYGLGGVKLCKSKGIKRSDATIRKKAYELNLVKKRVVTAWTEEDDNYLRENYDKKTKLELSNHLNRSENAISSRLCRLGLVMNNKWTDEEVSIVEKYYPKGGSRLCKANGLNTRHTSEINHKAYTLGLSEGVSNISKTSA